MGREPFFVFLYFFPHFVNDNVTISCLTLNDILHTMNYYNTLLTEKKSSLALRNCHKLITILTIDLLTIR